MAHMIVVRSDVSLLILSKGSASEVVSFGKSKVHIECKYAEALPLE